jgi:hypothetical protein
MLSWRRKFVFHGQSRGDGNTVAAVHDIDEFDRLDTYCQISFDGCGEASIIAAAGFGSCEGARAA